MTSQVSTKVRLVRCPKCLQVLAELPGVHVYKCGGCGTILQAKNRKTETNHTELSTQESDSAARSQQDNVSEEKEAGSSNHDLISPPKVEFSELCEGASVSSEISSSPEISSRCNEDSPSEVREPSKHEKEKTSGTCDGKFYDHENLAEHEDEENCLRPRAKHGERMKNNNYIRQNDEKSENRVIDQNDTISQSPEQIVEVDDEIVGLATFRSSSPDKDVSATAEDSKSFVSFYLSSPDDERSNKKLTQNFERVSSVDTFGSSPLGEPSSVLSVKHGDATNYTRPGSYYAYDGSESSCDGTDDQIREHSPLPSRKIKDSDYITTTEMLKKEGLRAEELANNERETNYWATSSRAMKSREVGGNKTRLDKHGVVSSRLRFTSRDVVSGPRTENPSSCQHNVLPARPLFRSSVEPSHLEPDKMDLLRTVCELKDQLSRMHFPTNRRFPGGAVEEKFAPFHYNHPGGYDLPRQQVWSEQHVPRMAFSGEAAHYRHQVNCSCLHCCPRDWHYSAQLPSNCLHCKNGHCRVPTENYTSSELLSRDDEMKRSYLKEKYNTTKRHIRPVVGGAPFVTCYYCSELLQLPADFLLFEKRYHQLMCNACRKVLKFSLLQKKHIVPYCNDGSAPPPSDAGEYNDTTTRRNFEPVSCSDDYGRSFCQSCSTSFDKGERNSYDRKMSSGSSFEPVEDRKMKSILRESPNKNENVESVGPSSKIPKWRKGTSEIECSNSPLHRLMGYTSPSQVLDK